MENVIKIQLFFSGTTDLMPLKFRSIIDDSRFNKFCIKFLAVTAKQHVVVLCYHYAFTKIL